jgi:hypothetical protein
MIPTPQIPDPSQPLVNEIEHQNYRLQFSGVINS